MSNPVSLIIRAVEEMKDDLLNEASDTKTEGNHTRKLADKIAKILPLHHGGCDLLHLRFAEALRDVLYIADLPEQKQYEYVDSWLRTCKETIDYTFHFGRVDSPDRERRTLPE